MKEYRKSRNAGLNKHYISVDACLEDEIEKLWSEGITTTGCCCGHNQLAPYIGVIDDDISKMKSYGYLVAINELDKAREDSFIPKTI